MFDPTMRDRMIAGIKENPRLKRGSEIIQHAREASKKKPWPVPSAPPPPAQSEAPSAGQNTSTTPLPAQPAPAAPAGPPPAAQQPQRFSQTDFENFYTAMQKQAANRTQYTVDQAVKDLERAVEDSQPGFQAQRNQINIDEAQARDDHVLYAAARGDRGGITARQYDSIANAAAQRRNALATQQQQLATDTTRQIADLRARGEFQKADEELQITQQQLSKLWELQQYEDRRAMQEAELTGEYQGAPTYAAQMHDKQAAREAALISIQMGILPPEDVLAAAGMDLEQAKLMAFIYAQTTGNQAFIDQYAALQNPDAMKPGHGFGGGGGGGRPGVAFDMSTDYQSLIDEAIANRDYAAAEALTRQRDAKLEALSQIDTSRNFQQEINDAIAAGDFQAAAELDKQRQAKLEAMKLAESLTNSRSNSGPGGPPPSGNTDKSTPSWLIGTSYGISQEDIEDTFYANKVAIQNTFGNGIQTPEDFRQLIDQGLIAVG